MMIRGERYPWLTADYLTQEYRGKDRSCSDIAAEWGCAASTVERRVRQFGIKKSNHEIYRVQDLTGTTFGRWRIGAEIRKADASGRYYECTCSCVLGTVQAVPAHRLREESPQPSRMCNPCVLRAIAKVKDKGFGEIPGYYWRNLCESAKQRGIPVEMTVEYAWDLLVAQESRCALTGLPIGFGPSKRLKTQTTASLDRIDAAGAYAAGNIRWVHKVVNRMRWHFSDHYFIGLCRNVVGHLRNRFGPK